MVRDPQRKQRHEPRLPLRTNFSYVIASRNVEKLPAVARGIVQSEVLLLCR